MGSPNPGTGAGGASVTLDVAGLEKRATFEELWAEGAVLSVDPIRNGSRRVIGTRYTVTVDAAEAIRASMAAYQDTLGD